MSDNMVYNPYTGEYEEDYIVGYGPDGLPIYRSDLW